MEQFYFDCIELFFLIVGHTHNILDQWFSVLGNAIIRAHFIGSVLAMHELYKSSHSEKKKNPEVYQLRVYRDYRKWFNPVRNDSIHHFNLPHRLKFEIDKFFGVCCFQYQFQSPPYGSAISEVWLPERLSARSEVLDDGGDVVVTPFATFSGENEIFEALGIDADKKLSSAINRDAKSKQLVDDANAVLPLLRKLEVASILENNERMTQEAEMGVSLTNVFKFSEEQLKAIDKEMVKGVTKAGGGNIIWIKRSQCADPEWLDKAPEVLPYPAKWRQMLKAKPNADAQVQSDDDDGVDLVNTSNRSAGPSVGPKPTALQI